MQIHIEKVGEVAVVTLEAEYLDASVAEEFKRDMGPLLEANPKVVFDMEPLQFVDSAGLGAILSCLRRLSAAGGDLKLCALSKPVRAVFEISRMHRIFDIFPAKEEAVQAFSA
jgi:anti-sigma B factor antagonist